MPTRIQLAVVSWKLGWAVLQNALVGSNVAVFEVMEQHGRINAITRASEWLWIQRCPNDFFL